MKIKSILRLLTLSGLLILTLNLLSGPQAVRAESPGVVEQTKTKAGEVTKAVTTSVEDAGRTAVAEAKSLWARIDEKRLVNRTADELVAWVIMGVLVGALAGMLTTLKTTGAGKLGRLLLGLAGAFLGGMIVHVAQIDFKWGPVLIRYEELVFSFVGALLVLGGVRLYNTVAKKQPKQNSNS